MAQPSFLGAKSWHVADWPELDQLAWRRATDPAGDADHWDRPTPRYGVESLKKIRHGYGRWISFLAARGWLDPTLAPVDRITQPHLRSYFRALVTSGNCNRTVVGRFAELAMAVQVMVPNTDTSWIRRLDGITVYSRLPAERRELQVPDAAELYAWGLGMMDEAGAALATGGGHIAYRDGLLIALLAARGRRRRSMALLTVGREIFKDGDHYRIELAAGQVKTAKPDRFDLPGELTPYIDRYLGEIRPALLGPERHDALWISQSGGPLTIKGLAERIHVLSRRRFGYSFGPHRFRHALSTMLATELPGNDGLAGAVLGISPAVVAAHYDRANQMRAASTLADLIGQRRRELARSARAGEFPLPLQALGG